MAEVVQHHQYSRSTSSIMLSGPCACCKMTFLGPSRKLEGLGVNLMCKRWCLKGQGQWQKRPSSWGLIGPKHAPPARPDGKTMWLNRGGPWKKESVQLLALGIQSYTSFKIFPCLWCKCELSLSALQSRCWNCQSSKAASHLMYAQLSVSFLWTMIKTFWEPA